MGISEPSGCALSKEHRALVAGLAVTAPGVQHTGTPRAGRPQSIFVQRSGALANTLEQCLQTNVQEHLCFTDLELAFPCG